MTVSPDGKTVYAELNGNIYAYDIASGTLYTVIATGGARGDFVGPDLTNGTLFLASADAEERLGIAGGCIGAACTTSVPEPASLAFFVGGIAGLAALSRRRKAKA